MKPFTDRNLKLTRWFIFKEWIKWKFQKLFGLFSGQSIWNKLYEDWGRKETKTKIFEESYLKLLNQIGEIRNEIHKQSLRGGPHVILLRNNARKLFQDYEKIFEKHWLENRSYFKKLFQVKFDNNLRKNWNVVLVDEPVFSKENPTSIFDIEAIYFKGNFKIENKEVEEGQIPEVNMYFVNEPQPNIVIKRNL